MPVVETKFQRAIQLLSDVGADNSPPALNSSGVDLSELRGPNGKMPEYASIVTKLTGTGTLTVIYRLWLLFPGNIWAPAGNGTGADKGKLNDAAAITETQTDIAAHAQLLQIPSHALRAYLEVLSLGGTTKNINALLIVEK